MAAVTKDLGLSEKSDLQAELNVLASEEIADHTFQYTNYKKLTSEASNLAKKLCVGLYIACSVQL